MSRYYFGRPGGRLSAAGSSGDGPAITVTARIEGVDKTSEEFRAARREFNTKMRDVIAAAGERSVLPAIKSRFPSRRWAASLYVKRDRTTVFIGSRLRGRFNRALGWLDFGGKRRRDRRRRVGPRVIVTQLGARRRHIDEAILVGLLHTFHPLETDP